MEPRQGQQWSNRRKEQRNRNQNNSNFIIINFIFNVFLDNFSLDLLFFFLSGWDDRGRQAAHKAGEQFANRLNACVHDPQRCDLSSIFSQTQSQTFLFLLPLPSLLKPLRVS